MINKDKNVVLIGFMGTGKSSVGRILARKLGRDSIDIDVLIEQREGRTISQIFETEGEAHFRQLEKVAIAEIAEKKGIVITTGGGAVLEPANLEVLRKNGIVVSLSADPETIYERVKHSRHRPLLRSEDRLAQIRKLLEAREPLYRQSDLFFKTDGCSSDKMAGMILNALERLSREAGPND